MKIPRILRSWAALFLGILIGVLSLTYFGAGEIYDYQDTVDGVHLPKVDAIVCLAGGRGRIAMAGDTWYRYWELSHTPLKGEGKSPIPLERTPILFISGMGPQSNWNVFAQQLRKGVRGVIKPENVILENESGNTIENAKLFAQFAKDRGWEKILLTTSRYHMKRAQFIFIQMLARYGLKVQIETMTFYQEPYEPNEWRESFQGVRVTMTEYLKWLYYKVFWDPGFRT